jgi:D-apiose dehydrogenase
MVYENWRWFAWFQEIRKLLESTRIGEVKYYRLVSRSSFTIPGAGQPAPILSNGQRYLKDMGRLLVYEFGIHLIDVTRFLFGDVDRVYARMGRLSSDVRGEDHALVVLDHGPVSGSIDVSWCSREPFRPGGKAESLLIEGTGGSIVLETTGRIRIITPKNGTEYHPYDWEGETKLRSHFRVNEHFVRCLREETPFQTDGRDNVKTLEAALSCYESAERNSVVSLARAVRHDG